MSGTTEEFDDVAELSSLVSVLRVVDVGVPVRTVVVVEAALWTGCAISTATRLANPPKPAAAATALLRLSVRSRARRSASARAVDVLGSVMASSSFWLPV